MITTRTLVAAALFAVLGLAGCGGDDGDSGGPTPAPSVSSSPTESMSPTETPSGSPDGTPSEEPTEQVVQVTIAADSVTPVAQTDEVAVGETLEVAIDSDREGELHVHSTPEQTFPLSPGRQTVEMTFDKPGTVDVEEHVADVLVLRVLVS